MGILPIGFFSPLPLAMMIPFMATQSLAMGEAFGKSFQYGKRKISSMSNEEFNKLTFHDLMIEQTANIRAIVPELNKQMAQSQVMQGAIFQEMVKLIPTFFDSLFSAFDPKHIEKPTLTSASPPPAVTEIRYADRRPEFNQPAIDELKKQLDKALEQRGTKESLAEKLRLQNLSPVEQYTTPAEKRIPSKKVLSASEDPEYLAWIEKLGILKASFQKKQKLHKEYSVRRTVGTKTTTIGSASDIARLWSDMFSITSKIRAMSNDYRNPNNHIRENAIRLRAELQSGIWSR